MEEKEKEKKDGREMRNHALPKINFSGYDVGSKLLYYRVIFYFSVENM